MKKLMYLLVAGSLSVFAACGGACSADCAKECCTVEEVVACADDCQKACCAVEEVVACADDCQKACCLGCKATEGEAKCIVLEDGSMPCCFPVDEEAHDHGAEGHSH